MHAGLKKAISLYSHAIKVLAAVFAFLGMLAFLQQHKQQSNQHAIIDAIYNKLEIYWNQHLSNSSSISAILDPRYKTTTFNNSVERNDCINHL